MGCSRTPHPAPGGNGKQPLDQAHAHGYLTVQERERLQAVIETVPGQRGPGRREGQVCLPLSAAPQRHHVHGIHRLLTYWGGEAIYRQHGEGPRSRRQAP